MSKNSQSFCDISAPICFALLVSVSVSVSWLGSRLSEESEKLLNPERFQVGKNQLIDRSGWREQKLDGLEFIHCFL
jgi:hypothetical protein